MRRLVEQFSQLRDLPSLILLGVIACTAAWTIALPLSPFAQDTTLKRFHLQSPNFAAWAVQQPVPSMYNFENRYWCSPVSLTETELKQAQEQRTKITDVVNEQGQFVGIETNAINHFPSRSFTFALTRTHLRTQPNRHFYLRSSYRGKTILSSFKTIPENGVPTPTVSENPQDTQPTSKIRLMRMESKIE